MSRLLSVALLPALVLLSYIYRLDTIEKEPWRLLLRLFLFGCLCALPASLLEWAGGRMISRVRDPLSYMLLNAFAVVAVAEEGCKYAVLSTTWNEPAFDYRYDAIVYAVYVSLGFGALENVLYVVRYGFSTGIFRAFTSVPGHCFFGVCMGYWYGNAKYASFYSLGNSVWKRFLAFLMPVILHGFYDFCCFMSGNFLFVLLFYGFLIIFFVAAIRCVRKASACDVPVRSHAMDEKGFL